MSSDKTAADCSVALRSLFQPACEHADNFASDALALVFNKNIAYGTPIADAHNSIFMIALGYLNIFFFIFAALIFIAIVFKEFYRRWMTVYSPNTQRQESSMRVMILLCFYFFLVPMPGAAGANLSQVLLGKMVQKSFAVADYISYKTVCVFMGLCNNDNKEPFKPKENEKGEKEEPKGTILAYDVLSKFADATSIFVCEMAVEDEYDDDEPEFIAGLRSCGVPYARNEVLSKAKAGLPAKFEPSASSKYLDNKIYSITESFVGGVGSDAKPGNFSVAYLQELSCYKNAFDLGFKNNSLISVDDAQLDLNTSVVTVPPLYMADKVEISEYQESQAVMQRWHTLSVQLQRCLANSSSFRPAARKLGLYKTENWVSNPKEPQFRDEWRTGRPPPENIKGVRPGSLFDKELMKGWVYTPMFLESVVAPLVSKGSLPLANTDFSKTLLLNQMKSRVSLYNVFKDNESLTNNLRDSTIGINNYFMQGAKNYSSNIKKIQEIYYQPFPDIKKPEKQRNAESLNLYLNARDGVVRNISLATIKGRGVPILLTQLLNKQLTSMSVDDFNASLPPGYEAKEIVGGIDGSNTKRYKVVKTGNTITETGKIVGEKIGKIKIGKGTKNVKSLAMAIIKVINLAEKTKISAVLSRIFIGAPTKIIGGLVTYIDYGIGAAGATVQNVGEQSEKATNAVSRYLDAFMKAPMVKLLFYGALVFLVCTYAPLLVMISTFCIYMLRVCAWCIGLPLAIILAPIPNTRIGEDAWKFTLSLFLTPPFLVVVFFCCYILLDNILWFMLDFAFYDYNFTESNGDGSFLFGIWMFFKFLFDLASGEIFVRLFLAFTFGIYLYIQITLFMSKAVELIFEKVGFGYREHQVDGTLDELRKVQSKASLL